jgi:hypothetical protein
MPQYSDDFDSPERRDFENFQAIDRYLHYGYRSYAASLIVLAILRIGILLALWLFVGSKFGYRLVGAYAIGSAIGLYCAIELVFVLRSLGEFRNPLSSSEILTSQLVSDVGRARSTTVTSDRSASSLASGIKPETLMGRKTLRASSVRREYDAGSKNAQRRRNSRHLCAFCRRRYFSDARNERVTPAAANIPNAQTIISGSGLAVPGRPRRPDDPVVPVEAPPPRFRSLPLTFRLSRGLVFGSRF